MVKFEFELSDEHARDLLDFTRNGYIRGMVREGMTTIEKSARFESGDEHTGIIMLREREDCSSDKGTIEIHVFNRIDGSRARHFVLMSDLEYLIEYQKSLESGPTIDIKLND